MENTIEYGFYRIDNKLLQRMSDVNPAVISDPEVLYLGPVTYFGSSRGQIPLFVPVEFIEKDPKLLDEYLDFGINYGIIYERMLPVLGRFLTKADNEVDTELKQVYFKYADLISDYAKLFLAENCHPK
ncbi:MAG: hypothetical protein ACI4I1_11065 [Oscillospiraceae bacterium]